MQERKAFQKKGRAGNKINNKSNQTSFQNTRNCLGYIFFVGKCARVLHISLLVDPITKST